MAGGVILDMDGLMLDTERIAKDAWKEASRQLCRPVAPEIYDQMVGLNVVACKSLLLDRYGPDFPVDALEELASAIYHQRLEHDVPIKAGLLEFIQFLEDHSIPRAVATSTATEFAIRKLSSAGVLNHFETVVGGDQVSKGKPEPDIYLLAAARIQQDPEDCIALEDSEYGIRAASAARMQTILIPDMIPPSSVALETAGFLATSLLTAIPIVERILRDRIDLR